MKLSEGQVFWERLGQQDPLWGVLSHERFHGDGASDEFFATGRRAVERVVTLLRKHGARPGDRALDFGCGVGRLSYPLADHVQEVVGIDVAESMVRRARAWNPDPARISFVCSVDTTLPMPDDSVDLVLSLMTLQHVPAQLSLRYLLEMARVTAPGGHIFVQIPSTVRSVEPMTAEACRAGIAAVDPPRDLAAGTTAAIAARIVNTSPVDWPPGPLLNLGNHWRRGAELVCRDDGRTAIPLPVSSGAATEITLQVTAPRLPGAYELELDIVHEHVAWWAELGNSPARTPVRVTDAAAVEGIRAPQPAHDAPDEGLQGFRPANDMPMHGLDHRLVCQLFEHLGCRVLSVAPDHSAGPEWHSYLYLIAAPG